jgi:hypothetical protein
VSWMARSILFEFWTRTGNLAHLCSSAMKKDMLNQWQSTFYWSQRRFIFSISFSQYHFRINHSNDIHTFMDNTKKS